LDSERFFGKENVMKNLLAVMLVFGMASMASAMTLQISVEGNPDPIDTQIMLAPSETIRLDIHSPDGYVIGDDVYFSLVVDPAYGVITGGVVTGGAPPDTGIYGYDALANGLSPGGVDDGMWGSVLNIAGAPVAPGIYIDDIIFHCEALNYDTLVTLWSTPDFATFTMEDQLIIHNIPEPATMALLSLGGLFFLRRRK
jgi:hypothetical protein